jgi:hypothetical protein
VGEEHPETLAQVQRFHAVLKPCAPEEDLGIELWAERAGGLWQ